MKCPSCGKEGFRYVEKNIKGNPSGVGGGRQYKRRQDKTMKCKKCGYEGVMA